MGTAKFDDGLYANPKFIKAGAAASWLWFCGVLFCRRGLTDGFIPYEAVPGLVVGLTAPYKQAQRLVDVGLWDVVAEGFQIHDYLEWNPSKDAMNAYRRKDRERKHRAYGIHMESPNGFRADSERIPSDGANARGTHAGAKSESESEMSRSSLSSNTVNGEEESARETALAPRWSRSGRTHGLMANHHLRCYRSPACERGVCVPGWLATEWRQQYGADTGTADERIGQVIAAALDALPLGPVGDEPKAFWRAVWLAAHGSSSPQAGRTKGSLTLDAARRVVAQRLAAGRAS